MAVGLLQSKERGIAAATNRGLERVKTEFVATTHDDCRVRNDWLQTLSRRVKEIGDAILTGRVEPEGDGIVLTVITSETPAVYTEPLVDGDVLFPPNMALPTRLFDRVGYFDEHPSLWFAGEDNEWAYRALRSGVPIIYEPEVVVGHVAWQRASDLEALYRRYARGQGSFYGKYLRRGDRFILRRALRDLVRGPWLLARGLATRNDGLVAMGRGEVMGIFPGIIAGLRRRRHE
jgi:GT2 family glycosyltransferase